MTGKMGKRTFYQYKDVALLTLDLESRRVKLNIEPVAEKSMEDNGVFKIDQEAQEYLDKENILYQDGPKFLEDQL